MGQPSSLAEAERENGWPEGEIVLLALIETARGVVNLKEIAGSDPRLQALIFGAEDLAGDIGAVRTRPGWEIFYARSAVVTHAAAFGLQAIDMVFMDLQDIDGLRDESIQGAQMAYTRQADHPSQPGAPVEEAFTPSDEAILHAQRVVDAAARTRKQGPGPLPWMAKWWMRRSSRPPNGCWRGPGRRGRFREGRGGSPCRSLRGPFLAEAISSCAKGQDCFARATRLAGHCEARSWPKQSPLWHRGRLLRTNGSIRLEVR